MQSEIDLGSTDARILTETVISMKQVSDHLPTRPHVATIWRWAQRGINGVRLESYKIGSQRVTSVEALNRFLKATQDGGK